MFRRTFKKSYDSNVLSSGVDSRLELSEVNHMYFIRLEVWYECAFVVYNFTRFIWKLGMEIEIQRVLFDFDSTKIKMLEFN